MKTTWDKTKWILCSNTPLGVRSQCLSQTCLMQCWMLSPRKRKRRHISIFLVQRDFLPSPKGFFFPQSCADASLSFLSFRSVRTSTRFNFFNTSTHQHHTSNQHNHQVTVNTSRQEHILQSASTPHANTSTRQYTMTVINTINTSINTSIRTPHQRGTSSHQRRLDTPAATRHRHRLNAHIDTCPVQYISISTCPVRMTSTRALALNTSTLDQHPPCTRLSSHRVVNSVVVPQTTSTSITFCRVSFGLPFSECSNFPPHRTWLCSNHRQFFCPLLESGCGNCGSAHSGTGCEDPVIETCVCAFDPHCCEIEWDRSCGALAHSNCDCGKLHRALSNSNSGKCQWDGS